MSNKTWVATTGLCVLMATSAAQAHLIPICVEAYDSGIEVGGAIDGVTRSFVTFTEAGGQPKPLAAVGSEIAMPYWRASSAPNARCVSQTDSTDSTGQRTASQGVGPGAGLLLMPVAGLVAGSETSLDPATNIAGLESSDQRQSPWSFDGAVNRRALLASTSTFGQSFGGYGARLIAPGEQSSRASVNTSEQGVSGAQATRPSVASGNSQASSGSVNSNGHSGNIGQGSSNGHGGNIGNAPVGNGVGNGAAGGEPGGNGGIGNIGNENISPVPGGGNGNAGGHTPATQVPEPETLALLVMGVLGIAISGRRRRELTRTA